MKKINVIILIMILAALTTLVACTPDISYADPKVVSLTVTGITKTDYICSDVLNIENAEVIATYDNGKTERVPLTKDMLDPTSYDMSAPGEYNVIVNYGGVSTSFAIRLTEWKFLGVSLLSEPYVKDYIVGEEVDTTGATVLCTFEGDKQVTYDVKKDDLQDYDNETVGVVTVKFTYYGVELSFDVEFHEKTPTAIDVIDDASENFVYENLSDRFDMSGMTVRVAFDNGQSPIYNVTEHKDDFIYMIDDSPIVDPSKKEKTVKAKLMYAPATYSTVYRYVYYGKTSLKVGDVVKPGQEIAGNKLDRDGQEITLSSVKSKSYGTIKSITRGDNGSSVMIIDTAIQYRLTEVFVKVGEIVTPKDPDNYLGKYASELVKPTGGGVVESVVNGVVVVRTAPTCYFDCIVKKRGFSYMEITQKPSPEKFFETTDINNIIQGDTLNRSTGKVRVHYDDESYEDFLMSEENHIRIVNAGVDSVNATLDISEAGRHELWICYGGVLENRVSMYVRVTGKYPVGLVIDETTNVISGREFYFGDTVSIVGMKYYVVYNNETQSEPEQLTEDMIVEGEGFGLYCSPAKASYTTSIRFCLPPKYKIMIPEELKNTLNLQSATFNYTVSPQPIVGIDFVENPISVYVSQKENIGFYGSVFNVYYRNNTYVSKKDFDSKKVIFVSVDSFSQIADYVPGPNEKGERMVVFTLNSQTAEIPVAKVLQDESYQARVIYFDEYETRSDVTDEFEYYLMNKDSLISEIKVILSSYGGEKGYKDVYAVNEDWDLTGVSLEIKYASTSTTARIPATSDMIYDTSKSKVAANVPVKFSYLGAKDEGTLVINVVERRPTSLALRRNGTTNYLNTYAKGIDFSGFEFVMTYNGGADAFISNLDNVSNKEVSSGWWYKMFNERGEQISVLLNQNGKVYYELYYSYKDSDSPSGYGYVSTGKYIDNEAYYVTVTENHYAVKSIRYPLDLDLDGTRYNVTYLKDDGIRYLNENTEVKAEYGSASDGKPLPVLTEVAAKWELMLSGYIDGHVRDKVIEVTYIDDEGNDYIGYVPVTNDMLDYKVEEKTQGYRRVVIRYQNKECAVYVYVCTATLTKVEVFIAPQQNYIYSAIESESDLVLDDGILRLTFTKTDDNQVEIGKMYKFVDMKSEDVSYSGFIKNSYSKEGTEIPISVQYKNYSELTASYNIRVFDKQDMRFSYVNTIFFYGNVLAADAVSLDGIPEFGKPKNYNEQEMIDVVTFNRYAELSEEERKKYEPYKMTDSRGVSVQIGYILKKRSVSGSDKGKFFVKYGSISVVDEKAYLRLPEATRSKFIQSTNYVGGNEENVYYTYEKNLPSVSASANVVVDKIDINAYLSLAESERNEYKELSNNYYLLSYIETKNTITALQYLKLSEAEQKLYLPITTYDENDRLVLSGYISRRNVVYGKYIDPAAGKYYVKYDYVTIIAPKDYDALNDDKKSLFTKLVNYGDNGEETSVKYHAVGKVEGFDAYEKVVVDKITVEDYAKLSGEEQALYEEARNEYYILMQVVDSRPLVHRYYETANYALKAYTIIQKVISVEIVAANRDTKVLRVRTSYRNENLIETNANPYAIVYLLNPNNIIRIRGEQDVRKYNDAQLNNGKYFKNFMDDVTVTSPNSDYFEISVAVNASYDKSNPEHDVAISELMRHILASFSTNDFVEATQISGVKVKFFNGFEFSGAEPDRETMTAKIRELWASSINVFDKADVESGNYYVSYRIAYGETLTRRGVLQLLSGAIKLVTTEDGYKIDYSGLSHDSYTIDLVKKDIIIE